MKSFVAHLILSSLIIVSLQFALPLSGDAQVRPIYDLGAGGLGQKLRRLQTTASAMHTAAHPDDEDSGLMAYLARRQYARVAYYSLNRGDGGQNVIGEELFEALGIIRTEELLQARRLDGGEQLFGHAMDYGFSKTLAEAKRMWNERDLLGDMVRAIRLYRPMVVISRFSGIPADGHGHHQMAGYLTPLAFRAAGDPNEFTEHFSEGLEPWRPLKLYVSQGFVVNPQNQPTLFLNTGTYDHLIGRSYFEIAMEGRSQHKSQEMGVLELRGPQRSGMRLVESLAEPVNEETSVFDGIDTSIRGIGKLTGNAEPIFNKHLADLQATAEEAIRTYNIYHPELLVPILARGYKQAYDAELSTRIPSSKAMVRYKRQEFADALQQAAGIFVDALSNREIVNQGGTTDVAVRVFAPEGTTLRVTQTEVIAPSDWKVSSVEEPTPEPSSGFRPRTETADHAAFFRVKISENAPPTQPYWMKRARKGAVFDWSEAGMAKNMPFDDPLLTARVKMEIGGQEITVEREVQYRFADDIRGEIRRAVNVVPAVTIGLGSDLLIAPVANQVRTYRVVTTVKNNTPGEITGAASLVVPNTWSVSPKEAPFTLPRSGDRTAFTFEVTVPANYRAGSYRLIGNATVGGNTFSQQMQEIAYPHIQTHRVFRPAAITSHVLDLDVAPVRVGYIMGSGDRVPEAIRRLGLDVTLLDEKDLSTGELSVFDTIVVGIRASQVRADFVANNGRLLEYARNGGSLVVQYQQHEYVQNNLQPFPASMTGVTRGNQRISNLRVTDENAKVNVLVPDHPIFNYPNKISESDWDNWVQERNLYCFTTFDERYIPLLESRDEGEDENKGGMLYARLGKGHYLYTSYSWFRQLPAGTPGAYRIFANILSLPKAEKQFSK
jgi:LmbE family N-acetylglucosaminyl deacetylase